MNQMYTFQRHCFDCNNLSSISAHNSKYLTNTSKQLQIKLHGLLMQRAVASFIIYDYYSSIQSSIQARVDNSYIVATRTCETTIAQYGLNSFSFDSIHLTLFQFNTCCLQLGSIFIFTTTTMRSCLLSNVVPFLYILHNMSRKQLNRISIHSTLFSLSHCH